MADNYEILADGDTAEPTQITIGLSNNKDSTQYDVLADGDTPSYSSAKDLPASIVKKAAGGLLNSLGGAVSAVEDYQPYLKYLSPFTASQPDLADTNKVGQNIVGAAQNFLKDINQQYNFEPGSVSSYVDQAGTAVGQMIPALLTGGVAPAVMLGQAFGSDYANATTEGQTKETALKRAALNAPINYLANKVTLKPLLKGDIGLGRRVLESTAANVVTSPFQTAANTIVNQNTGETPLSYPQFKDRIKNNLITDTLTGVAAPVIAHPIAKLKERYQNKQSLTDVDNVINEIKKISETQGAAPENNLPAVIPSEKPKIKVSQVINAETFPKVMKYVQKNIPDKGAQEGFVNALKIQREKILENKYKHLPVVIPSEKPKIKVSQVINAETFPKVMKYVQKNIPDKGAQEGFVNALKIQREKILENKYVPDGLLWNPRTAEEQKVNQDILNEIDGDTARRRSYSTFLDSLPEERAQELGLLDAKQEREKRLATERILKGQRGSAPLEAFFLAKKIGATNKDAIKVTHETLDQAETQKIIKRYGGNTNAEATKLTPNKGEQLTSNYITKVITSPEEIARVSPEFKPFLNAARKGLEIRDETAHKLSQTARDYFTLPDTARVDDVLAAYRKLGSLHTPTPEALTKLGLNEREVKAFFSYRETMNQALDIYEKTLVDSGVDPAEASAKVADLTKSNYVPFSRFGEYFVRAYTPDGKTAGFWMFKKTKEMEAKVAELKKGGVTTDFGQYKEDSSSPDGNMYPAGFGDHLLQSFEVPGYNKNLRRNLAEYITSLSHHASRTYMKNSFETAFNGLPERSPSLVNYAKNYSDYVLNPGAEGSQFRKALTAYYLGFNLKSALVNTLQTTTTTLPKAISHLGVTRGAKVLADAGALLSHRFTDPKGFAKKYPELNSAIDQALSQGTITEQGFREVSARSRSISGDKSGYDSFIDKSMTFFDMAEKFNRYTAFIAGHEIAVKKGLSGDAITEFAKQFVTDTQFDYSRVNRPEFARGQIGAPLTTFRLFTYNYLRFLKNISKDEHGAKGLVAALAAMGSIGGVMSFPFFKEFLKGAELAGFDPKNLAKKNLNQSESDLLLYGLPFAFNLADISGSAGVGEIVPLPGGTDAKDVYNAIGRTALGVAGDFVTRPLNAYDRYSQGDTNEAIQSLLPESLKNISVAAMAYKNNAFTNSKGQRVLNNPSPYEIGIKALGLTPKRLRDNYDKIHSIDVLGKRSSDNENINHKIARAKVEGRDWRAVRDKYIQGLADKEYFERTMPNPAAIRKMEKALRDPISGALSNLPNRAKAEAYSKYR